MRGATRAASRFIALLLTFILGFVTCVGAVVGAAYFVYAKVSLDTLTESDIIDLDTSEYLDSEKAIVSLTSLTIKDFIEEVSALSKIPETVTINMLVERYGVRLTSEARKYLTDDICNTSIKDLTTAEGRSALFKSLYIGSFLGYTKEANPAYDPSDESSAEYLWYDKNNNRVTGIEALAAGFNLYAIMNGELNYQKIVDSLTIADVMTLKPTVLPAYTQNASGELVEVSGVSTVTVWYQNNGDEAGMLAALADASISTVGSSLNSMNIADVMGYVSVPEVDDNGEPVVDDSGKAKVKLYKKEVSVNSAGEKYVLLTEESNGITAELGDLGIGELSQGGLDDKINNIELVSVLKYEQIDGVWYTQSGEKAESFMVAMLYGPDGQPTTINNISDTIGSVKVGEFAGYTYDEELGVWLDGDGAEADGILATLADLTVEEMTDNGMLTDKIQTLELVDVLGYEEHDGVWYEVYDAANPANNVQISDFMAALIVDDEGNLTTVESVSEAIDGMQVGKLAGYENHDGVWYEVYDADNPDNNVEASGILATIADLTVKEMSDNDTLTEEIQNVTLVDVLGYEEHDGVWYEVYDAENPDNNVEVTSFMTALIINANGEFTKVNEVSETVDTMTLGELTGYDYDPDSDKWTDVDGNEPNGIIGGLIDMTVADFSDSEKLSDRIHSLELYVVLDYTKVDGVWYEVYDAENPENNVKASSLMAALFESDGEYVTVDGVGGRVDTMLVGEFAGFTAEIDEETGKTVWYDESGKEAKGVLAALADMQVTDLSDEEKLTDKIQTVEVGYAVGYHYDEDNDVWYETYVGEGSSDNVEASGVMAAIAGTPVGSIQDTIDDTTLGALLDYEENNGEWKDGDGNPAPAVLAAIAGLKFSELSNEDLLTEKVQTIKVGDALGYEERSDGWYSGNDKLTGVMAVIAGEQISNIEGTINSADLGEILGYEKKADGWYNGNDKVTGVMAVVADSNINELHNTIEETQMGEFLGFTYDEATDWWYSGDVKAENKVHVLMNSISGKKISEMDNLSSTLKIKDIVPAEDLASGYMSLLDSETTIDKIAFEVNDVFTNRKLHEFISSGAIAVDNEVKPKFAEGTELGDMTITELINYVATIQ